jgi:uncharacterized UPF0160 family protein
MKRGPNTMKIGTHSGTFHCDEALACFLLHQTEEFSNAAVVRSRVPEVLKTCDILVDVGAVYNPETHRYDHHQAGFTETLDAKHSIKLSSAGLIYKHFGRHVIGRISGVSDQKIINIIFDAVYTNFIEGIDAIDNGVSQHDTPSPARYKIRTDLSSRVGNLNPAWNDSTPNLDELFQKAMQLTGSEFIEAVNYLTKVWLPARSIVEDAVKNCAWTAYGGLVTMQGCPWKEHLFDIEQEIGIEGKIMYAITQDTRGDWMVQSVPVNIGSFDNRAPFPAPWRGIRDEKLSELTGISGCIFIHANGFIGGHKTKEGAYQLANLSLEVLNLTVITSI